MKRSSEYLTSNLKRELDVFGGLAIAAVVVPAAAAVGALAAADTREINPLFTQVRVGKNNLPFQALKFRTIAKNAMSETHYGTFDPRATHLGQLLRQTGLDEIPQICNVIAGSMSLVGARPLVEKDIDYMEFAAPHVFDEWYAYYQISRPGLAGPSQVYRHHFRNGQSKEIYSKSAELDLRYFENASLAEDIRILGSTPLAMLRANIGVIEAEQTFEPSTSTPNS